MRATALILLSALCVPVEAHAEQTCPLTESVPKPRLFFMDSAQNYRMNSVLEFRVYFAKQWARCLSMKRTIEKTREPKVELQFLVGDKVVDRRDGPLYLRKTSDREAHTLAARLFPGQACDKNLPPGGRRVVQGPPGKELVMQMVPVRARVVAEGDLAPMAFTSDVVEYPCPACLMDSGSMGVRAEGDGSLVLKAEVSREWFECARFQATLNLSGFVGKSEDEVESALRPDFVWEGLEKAFKREGDKYVLHKPLPMAQLCKMGKKWGFDLWGRGQLSRSGGRSFYELPCH
jgi:hypothetical protein